VHASGGTGVGIAQAGARGSRAKSGGALLIGPCACATSTLGQEAELEQVFVTGSALRVGLRLASPIVSVTRELFERTVSNTVETALNTLPQFVPAYTSTSNNPSNGGQANVQLRGLGTTSTLVLIDGKRLIPANGTGVVDLNIIPGSLIESVEIITGGASAVYGSDAVAGVVNFRLRKEFDGVELDAQWGQTDRSDGTDYGGGVTGGLDFADGRGSVLGYVGYAERESVLAGQRDFSRYALRYAGPDAGSVGPGALRPLVRLIEEGRPSCRGRPDAVQGLFATWLPGSSVPYQTEFGFNTDGTVFTGDRNPGSVPIPAARSIRCSSMIALQVTTLPVNYLQLPLEASRCLCAPGSSSAAAELYAQGLCDYTADAAGADRDVLRRAHADQPVHSSDLQLLLDSREDPARRVLFKRMSELGPRISSFEYDVYQVTLGLRGQVFDGWSYDAYLQIGANDQTDTQSGNALNSRIEELTFAPDGGEAICGGFNPFGLGSISAECAAYIAVDGTNRAGVDQTILEASLSGPLLQLPAGELRAAFGVFYKKDEYFYNADAVASVSLRTVPTSLASTRRMTSRARTTTPTCMSRRRCHCSRIDPVSARSRRSWATGTRTTPRRVGRTRTRPSFCIDRSTHCACAVLTSTPYGRRACSSSICRSCKCPFSFPLTMGPSILARRIARSATDRTRHRSRRYVWLRVSRPSSCRITTTASMSPAGSRAVIRTSTPRRRIR
jgi:outer membrane receptor protein involved in Fe transport